MTNKTNTLPEGYHTLTPYLAIKWAAQKIKVYSKPFGAKEVGRISMFVQDLAAGVQVREKGNGVRVDFSTSRLQWVA